MTTASLKRTSIVLEKVKQMPLPTGDFMFEIKIEERENKWIVNGIIDGVAHRSEDYPPMYMTPTADLDFSSKKNALAFARELSDVLIERGGQEEAYTTRLLRN